MKSLFLVALTLFFGSALAQKAKKQIDRGISFAVDPVEKATVRLNEMNAEMAFENELGKEIQFFPDELTDAMVVPGRGNCFVSCIHKSFDEHRPLMLTPDAVWLTICQGVSIHINQHFDELESHIFKVDKPSKIKVRNDSLFDGSAHWADLLHAFSDSTKQYINDDYYAFFAPKFSSTTDIIHTCYEVTMLEGFSKAFEYFGDTGCGIPFITLKGNKDDWQEIHDRLTKVDELGLEVWARELRGVIQKFIDIYDDKTDLDFWQSIYKDHSEYGAFYVSGWFIKFFPYVVSTGKMEHIADKKSEYYGRAPKIYIPNDFLEGDRYLISRLSTDDFPSGISEIDVHWDNWGEKQEMKVHAGFYGMVQHENLSLEPAISWAVHDQSGEDIDHNYNWNKAPEKHRFNFWSPGANLELTEIANYAPESFPSSEESHPFVIEKIVDYIENNSYYSMLNLKGKSVELLISAKGTVLDCKSENLNPLILNEVKKAVSSLPKKWSPAMANFTEFIDEYAVAVDDIKFHLLPANSWVRLEFD